MWDAGLGEPGPGDRSTLQFAGLFLMAHELVKHVVIKQLREFYGLSELLVDSETLRYGYAAKVLALDVDESGKPVKKPRPSRASILSAARRRTEDGRGRRDTPEGTTRASAE